MSVQVKGSGTIGGIDEGLSIAGVSTFTGNVIVDSGTVRCNDGFSSDVDLIFNADANNNGTGSIIFKESGSETVRVEASGNIGIGTNNPNNLLHVYGGQLKVQSNPSDTSTNLDLIRAQCGSTGNALFSIRAKDAADNNSDWDIKTNANENLTFSPGGNTEKVRFTSDGKVGINTTNPNHTLHVFGQGTTLAIFGDEDSGSYEALGISNAQSGYPAITQESSTDTLDLRSYGSVQATIDSNNNSTGKYFRVMNNGAGNAGTELFRVSDDGYVTKPQTPSWVLRPSYSTNQTLSSGTHAVGWSSSDNNTHAKGVRLHNVTLSGSGFSNNLHNGQNYGKINVPVAGIYRVWCTIRMENNCPNAGNLMLYVDGSQIVRQHVEMWNHQPYMHGRIEHIVNLNANSYIIWALNCSGGIVSGIQDTVNWCGGHLIG